MFNLSNFNLPDMIKAGKAIRAMADSCHSTEEIAFQITRFIYRNFFDIQSKSNNFVLVRFFMTLPFSRLPLELQLLAAKKFGERYCNTEKWLTLLSTHGDLPLWNDRRKSKEHQIIPLNEDFISSSPMINGLLSQFGITLNDISNRDKTLRITDSSSVYNVFFVSDTKESPVVYAKDDFVIPFSVKSALGFGGKLVDDSIFTVLLFSKIKITEEIATMFKPIALNTKYAVSPFTERIFAEETKMPGKEEHDPVKGNLLKTTGADILEEILQVTEDVVKTTSQTLRKYEQIVNSSKELMSVIDRNYVHLTVNDEYAKALNMEKEVIKRYTLLDVFGQETFMTSIKSNIDKCLSGQEIKYRAWLNFKGRGNRFMEIFCYPLYDKEKTICEVVINAHDITDHKHAEEQYSTIIKTTEDGFLAVDYSGGLIDVNESYCRMTGYSRDELLTMSIHDIEANESSMDISKHIDNVARKGHDRFETLHRSKNGAIINVEVSTSYMKTAGKGYFFSFIRDVTTRKKMEEHIERTHKLESIGTLAGGIAHDFNNYLVGILLNIQIIKMKTKQDDKNYRILETIEKAISQAEHLSNQLLAFSGWGEPVKKIMNINELLEEATEFTLKGTNTKAVFKLKNHLYAEVDKGQVYQVITNIVMNAVHAMPDGGFVEIHSDSVKIDGKEIALLKNGEYIRISVKDYGIGISDEHLSRIFDPFFTTKKVGKGLGLATTYFIIQKHGGHISVDSTQGVGTTFHICLPASKKKAEKKVAESFSQLNGSGKVLVVDDNKELRDAMELFLTDLGYYVVCVEDGEKAITAFKESCGSADPFVLAFLDLTIPGGMGGKEIVGYLIEEDHSIKAVMMSGYSKNEIMANYREYGFHGVLKKPFTFEQLCNLLREL